MYPSVIIPSRNVRNLIACVEALCEWDPGLRIIVVDDGLKPDDMQREIFYKWDHTIRPYWMSGEKPFNFARNMNLGIRKANPEADVILLNDDALLRTRGGFRALQAVANEHQDYGIIGAVTNVTGQELQWPLGHGLRPVPHFAFVCVLIPRRTIRRVGMLDERYCLDYGCEDRDYCEACTRAGLKVGVYDFCYVDHGSLTSTYRGDPRASRSYAMNQALFEEKWR